MNIVNQRKNLFQLAWLHVVACFLTTVGGPPVPLSAMVYLLAIVKNRINCIPCEL